MIDSDGAWICIHCGAMRDGGRLCDIPYEVKRILREIEGVELLDEVSRIAAATLRFSYMFLTPHFSSSIRASGALVHFLLKSPDVCHAGGDDSVRWHRLNAGWEPI